MNWWRRLTKGRQLDKQITDELRFHFECQVADYMRAGMTASEARRRAQQALGGLTQISEDCRQARGTAWFESVLQDLRFAFRTLWKSPGFALTAVIMLALGIGANAAIFQLLDALLLRSLPVSDPKTLVTVQLANGKVGTGILNGEDNLTYPVWEEIRRHNEPFSGTFGWASNLFRLGRGSDQRPVAGIWTSGEMFPVLGIRPFRGRLFGPADDEAGAPSGVVISYAFWQREFGGRDSAIGSNLVIQEIPTEVIGVTPPEFFGLEVGQSFEIALPPSRINTYFPGSDSLTRRDYWWLNVMGRLKPGWSVERASAYLASMSPGIFEATIPTGYKASTLEEYRQFQLAAFAGGNGVSFLRRLYNQSLWLLLGMTGLVLLIACANLANLMLARASTREREMAVRLALGASRVRLIRQLLSESILLAASGAALGIAVSAVLSRVILGFQNTDSYEVKLDLSTDWRVIAFTAAVALMTCILFGLAPAWRSSRIEAGAAMKAGGRGMTAGRERFSFQRVLVGAQIAISLVCLVGAALFVRTFQNLVNLDPGFRRNGIVIAFMNLKRLNLTHDRLEPFKQELLEELRTIPEVESVASATHIPLDGSSWTLGVHIEGAEGTSKFTWASPGYFRTMQIPLIAGRDFNAQDTATSQSVAVVNETFVRKYLIALGGRDPIGRTIRTIAEPNYPETNYVIVGVTKDTKYAGLREVIPPTSFVPAIQHPDPAPFQSFVIRSSASPATVISAVKSRIGSSHPGIVTNCTVFERQIQDSLRREKLMAALSGFFGVIAALLATVGLSGVISYIVVKRRHEIGIRMALGARRGQVIQLVMREAAVATAIGLCAGLLVSLAATRGAATFLFGLKPNDPLTMAGAAALLGIVAAVASWLPALNASRVDPMSALRDE